MLVSVFVVVVPVLSSRVLHDRRLVTFLVAQYVLPLLACLVVWLFGISRTLPPWTMETKPALVL